MAKKVAKEASPTDAGKSISTQLSDLRMENKSLRKLYASQQAQINELQGHLNQLNSKIGM